MAFLHANSFCLNKRCLPLLLLLLLPLQLADAQAQLSALNRHVEAIMLGYAEQALQAGSKARQAAMHQQALREQQEVRGGCSLHNKTTRRELISIASC